MFTLWSWDSDEVYIFDLQGEQIETNSCSKEQRQPFIGFEFNGVVIDDVVVESFNY